MNKKKTLLVLLLCLGLAMVYFLIKGFGDSPEVSRDISKTFTLLSADYTEINFVNQVNEIPGRSTFSFDYFYSGAGLAVGDFNNDGLPDVFFAGNDVPNRLYLNKGNLRFEDISKKAGIQSKRWATGVTLVDINKDGWLDIYVCNSGPYKEFDDTKNELYINNQNNTFTEQAAQYGIDDYSRSIQASFFDMDKDGDLDLWVMNHSLRNLGENDAEWHTAIENLNRLEYKRQCNTLFRNDGNGRFTNISEAAGIEKVGFGLGMAVSDFNEDGYLDVYVANDYLIPDFMFLNNGNGTFSDQISNHLKHVPFFSMGCDAADFNNDGLTDLITVDMTPADHVRNKTLMLSMDVPSFDYLTNHKNYLPQYMYNSLFLNNGYGIMSDIAQIAGVSQTDWSWAPLFSDLNNDGLKDLLITNGYRKDTKHNDWRLGLIDFQKEKGETYTEEDFLEYLKKAEVNPTPNQVFQNFDGLNFGNVTNDWGFDAPSFTNGAAYADLDDDGDLDLIMNNFDIPAFVYRNNSREKEENHYIRFKLKDGATSNGAMHSQVYIYQGDKMQRNDYSFTRGYMSYVEPFVHFGLGDQARIDSAVILWPNGARSIIYNPKADQIHIIDKKQTPSKVNSKEKVDYAFRGSTEDIQPPFYHRENAFNDFQKEVLLPHRQSMLGPAITVADVNGDGLEDFYVGGAKDQAGALYLQTKEAKFHLAPTLAFVSDKGYEDVGAVFLDVEGDGDQDLYVGSGGGGDFVGSEDRLQDRLYLNDGTGNFILSSGHIPKMKTSTQAIVPADWDGDGDQDLFIGGRTTPGKYPLPPNSYLLLNNGGTFTDLTQKLAPELSSLGMVTDAEWSDIDNDGKLDLIIAGEWLPITAFKNTGNGFENITASLGLEKTAGWWYSLHKVDYDQDGDEDFIAGNLGLNNKFHPSAEKPLYVYANDFDNNGTLDIVLSKIYNEKKVPVRGRECSNVQMPFISENFPTYSEFANASLEDIYSEVGLNEAIHYKAYSFESVFIENQGNGQFTLKELPIEAQISPINGIVSSDFDKDGNVDLIFAGNMTKTEVETPAYDSGRGLYLKGLGKGEFMTSLKLDYSGLLLHTDVKDIQLIHLGADKNPALLIANNNDALELYVYTNKEN